MRHGNQGRRPAPGAPGTAARPSSIGITGAIVASTAMALAPGALRAQGVESRSAQQPAATPRRFDIPAGPLDAALRAYETATGLAVDVPGSVAGLTSKGVAGSYTPQQALGRLLDGTPLTYLFTGTGTVALRTRATDRASETAMLGTVQVTAAAPGAVSSPKYTEPPVDIPRTITVVGQEQIKAQAATSLRDVVRNVPGITINAGEGGALPGDNFNIRGFSATSDIFVDGVRDVSGYSRESFNLEQVEVTKGPSSSVSGRGSTGGSINMSTKVPSLREARSAGIVLGSADQRRATIDVNQPLEGLGLRSAAVRVNAVTSEGGVPGNDVIHNENWGIAPSLSLGLGKPTQLTLSYLRSKQDNTPSYGIENFNAVPTVDTRHFFGLRSLDFEHVASNVATARVDHRFGAWGSLRSQLTRGHSETGRIVTPANPTTGVRSPKTHRFDNDIVASQTNLTTAFRTGGIGHDLITGVEASHEKSLRGGYNIVNKTYPKIADLANPTADADFRSDVIPTLTRRVRANSVGAYALETMTINRYLELNGNVRWDSYRPEYTDSASLATQTKGNFQVARTRAVSGGGALVVKPRQSGSLYASYGTSFNPSTENLSNDAVSAAVSLPPERSRSYEVGTKWELFRRRLLTSVALFRTEKTNARTTDPANPGLGTILAGKQRVEGGELNVTGQVTQKWSITGGYANMDSKYTESPNPAQVGTSLLNVPKHSVNTWTTYHVTSALNVGGGARYVDHRLLRSTTTTTATGTTTTQVFVPSYHAYDAVAAYRVNATVNLQVNAYNLTDKLYYDAGRMWVPAPGRALSVTTSLTF